MNEIKYRLYCLLHHSAKRILGRTKLSVGNIIGSPNIALGVPDYLGKDYWNASITHSKISQGQFSDSLYAGYIAEYKEWCLPSWIWTNAATVRVYCACSSIEKAKLLADNLAAKQQECGGWIVRNDYDRQGSIPMLAPNYSAYIANNAFVELYHATKETRYLDIARRCAEWIIETA